MQLLSGRKGKTSIINMRDVWVSWARLLLNVHSGNKNRSYSLVKAHSLKIVEWFISEEHCVIVYVRFFMFYISQRVGCDWDAIFASFLHFCTLHRVELKKRLPNLVNENLVYSLSVFSPYIQRVLFSVHSRSSFIIQLYDLLMFAFVGTSRALWSMRGMVNSLSFLGHRISITNNST